MKYSPLQLIRYCVPELVCSANGAFDSEKACDDGTDQFSVEVSAKKQNAPANFSGHPWSIEMVITQKIGEKKNIPYQFKVTVFGIFACKSGSMQEEKESLFVKVNGSSVLYGVARELIRSTTALGPWGERILPTVSFYEKETAQKEVDLPNPKDDKS